MAIPPLNNRGVLPDGIHDCTFPELAEAFGQNQWVVDASSETHREILSRQRSALCSRLEEYLSRLREAGLQVEVLVDGSFVTNKVDPNDIDLIVVLPADHDFATELSHRVYDLLSKRRLRDSGYPFDVVVVAFGDSSYQGALQFFQHGRDALSKGLLKVKP
jgi:Nucleotidyltransferase domain